MTNFQLLHRFALPCWPKRNRSECKPSGSVTCSPFPFPESPARILASAL